MNKGAGVSPINPLSLTNRVHFPICLLARWRKWEGTENKVKMS